MRLHFLHRWCFNRRTHTHFCTSSKSFDKNKTPIHQNRQFSWKSNPLSSFSARRAMKKALIRGYTYFPSSQWMDLMISPSNVLRSCTLLSFSRRWCFRLELLYGTSRYNDGFHSQLRLPFSYSFSIYKYFVFLFLMAAILQPFKGWPLSDCHRWFI
jgi:hypothetical protein